ncbi:hypothetical protein P9Z80_24070 [Bacillus cereus]|nr:hypothetical protein [Bacillus cereus]MEC3260688.1 hypothetical protein [Bacillus cereus]
MNIYIATIAYNYININGDKDYICMLFSTFDDAIEFIKVKGADMASKIEKQYREILIDELDFNKESYKFEMNCINTTSFIEVSIECREYVKQPQAFSPLKNMKDSICKEVFKYIKSYNKFHIQDLKFISYKKGKLVFRGYEYQMKELVVCYVCPYDFTITAVFEKSKDLEFYLGKLTI